MPPLLLLLSRCAASCCCCCWPCAQPPASQEALLLLCCLEQLAYPLEGVVSTVGLSHKPGDARGECGCVGTWVGEGEREEARTEGDDAAEAV